MKKHAFCNAFYVRDRQDSSALRLSDLLSSLSGSPLFTPSDRSADVAGKDGKITSAHAEFRGGNDDYAHNSTHDSQICDGFHENGGFTDYENQKNGENRDIFHDHEKKNRENRLFSQNSQTRNDEKTKNVQNADGLRNKKPQKYGGEKDYFSPPPYYDFP